MENLRSCNKYKERICTEEGESVFTVKREERRNKRVHTRTTEKRIYPTLKVVSNGTGVFYRKKEW